MYLVTPENAHLAAGAPVYRAQTAMAPNGSAADGPGFWGEDGFTFDDLVDLINPLHHLPVVGTFYREMTDDRIAPGPRLMGAALFGGGPIGAAIGVAKAAIDIGVENSTGKDVGGHVLAALGLVGAPEPAPDGAGDVQVAGLPWLNGGVEVAGLPWLGDGGILAPDLVEQHVAPAGAETVAIATLPPPALNTARLARAPEPPAMEPTPAAAEARGTAVPTLDEAQWAALLARVPNPRAQADQRPPPPTSTSRGHDDLETIPAETLRPFDLSAAMTSALDKYSEMAQHRRPRDVGGQGGIDQVF